MTTRRVNPVLLATALAGLAAAPACADRPLLPGQMPHELQDIGITEHLDETIPLDLEFVRENGERVKLGDLLDGERPVILTLNYYRCTMLCGSSFLSRLPFLRRNAIL